MPAAMTTGQIGRSRDNGEVMKMKLSVRAQLIKGIKAPAVGSQCGSRLFVAVLHAGPPGQARLIMTSASFESNAEPRSHVTLFCVTKNGNEVEAAKTETSQSPK